ncbi:hypothetical protein J7K99_05600, partial [bacterium]|nr:hypothetical protein [bacterium]
MKRSVLLCVLLLVISFAAAVPAQINYQGKITNSAGVALEGTYDMTFRLYNVATGGTALWSETHSSVGVHRGLFDVILGETNPIDLPFDEQYYLEIEVEGEVLSPRIPLTSVGYSFRAAVADSAAAVDLDTLGAYWDTTNHFSNFTQDSIDWDTLGAYSDTLHTHSLVLTGDISAAGAVSGTLFTDISAGAVDWDELSSAVQDSIQGDWVQLSPSSPQTDPDATPAIYINKTGVGQLLVFQKDGTDRITISNSGNEFSMVGPGATKSIVSDSALAISANKGATFTIDADNTSSTVSLRILHDYGDTLFWISEANYVGIAPRDGAPSATPRGGLYVNGNSSGTDTLFFYDGAGWKPLMTSDMVSGSFILNQYSSEQSANFLISGKGHIHNTADSDTAFVSREGGAGGIGGYFRGGSGSSAVALVAERPTENNRAELANADAGVYGEVDGSDESAVIGHNIASSGTDSAKGVLGVADGAGGTIHIGVQGTASGAAENYGGFFSPMLGIAPQTSLPAGANGGLCVKDGSPDSLFFYDGTTWTPVKTGYESVQWEQAGSSPNRYKRP